MRTHYSLWRFITASELQVLRSCKIYFLASCNQVKLWKNKTLQSLQVTFTVMIMFFAYNIHSLIYFMFVSFTNYCVSAFLTYKRTMAILLHFQSYDRTSIKFIYYCFLSFFYHQANVSIVVRSFFYWGTHYQRKYWDFLKVWDGKKMYRWCKVYIRYVVFITREIRSGRSSGITGNRAFSPVSRLKNCQVNSH